MGILFVTKNTYQEHLGIMSLSSILRREGYNDIDIVAARYDKIARKLQDTNFRLLAYSAESPLGPYYLKLNQKIKENFRVFSAFGGLYPTQSPEIINEPGVDGICIGEGDYAFLDLARNLTESKPIYNLPNWWIKQDGEVFRNQPRPLVKDLDSLPFVDRTLFPHFYTIFMTTSRGCCYNCAFCSVKSDFRRRSVDNVIEELKEINAATKIRFVWFCDNTFNISLPWIEEFAYKYRREINLPFYCDVRADLVTRESIALLKEAGCFSLGMGIETANDDIRNKIFNKGLSKEQIILAAEIIKKYKIRLRTYNIIGMPFGSLEDDLETLKLNIRLSPDYSRAALFTFYKNTDIYHSSSGSFGSLPDSHKVENLRKLFSFIVNFPCLLPLVPFLINLPLQRFYAWLYVIWRGWCAYFRINGGCFLGPKSFIERIKRYMKASFHSA